MAFSRSWNFIVRERFEFLLTVCSVCRPHAKHITGFLRNVNRTIGIFACYQEMKIENHTTKVSHLRTEK